MDVDRLPSLFNETADGPVSPCNAPEVLLIFASTSGKTRQVFIHIAAELVAWGTPTSWELGVSEPPCSQDSAYALYILGSPTYGRGDWHYRWEDNFDKVLEIIPREATLALVALGDQRFHGKSFAGALDVLHQRTVRSGRRVITVDTGQDIRESSGERQPLGLVLDLRESRRTWAGQTAAWVESVRRQVCGSASLAIDTCETLV